MHPLLQNRRNAAIGAAVLLFLVAMISFSGSGGSAEKSSQLRTQIRHELEAKSAARRSLKKTVALFDEKLASGVETTQKLLRCQKDTGKVSKQPPLLPADKTRDERLALIRRVAENGFPSKNAAKGAGRKDKALRRRLMIEKERGATYKEYESYVKGLLDQVNKSISSVHSALFKCMTGEKASKDKTLLLNGDKSDKGAGDAKKERKANDHTGDEDEDDPAAMAEKEIQKLADKKKKEAQKRRATQQRVKVPSSAHDKSAMEDGLRDVERLEKTKKRLEKKQKLAEGEQKSAGKSTVDSKRLAKPIKSHTNPRQAQNLKGDNTVSKKNKMLLPNDKLQKDDKTAGESSDEAAEQSRAKALQEKIARQKAMREKLLKKIAEERAALKKIKEGEQKDRRESGAGAKERTRKPLKSNKFDRVKIFDEKTKKEKETIINRGNDAIRPAQKKRKVADRESFHTMQKGGSKESAHDLENDMEHFEKLVLDE